jgi:hypothetical protein
VKDDVVLVWVPKSVRNTWKANAARKGISLKAYLKNFESLQDDSEKSFERLKRGLF